MICKPESNKVSYKGTILCARNLYLSRKKSLIASENVAIPPQIYL